MLGTKTLKGRKALAALLVSLMTVAWLVPALPIGAADHGDGPGVSVDRSADLNDIYAFVDPNDNSKVVVILTVNGFIVPSEAVNFGIFDPGLRYRFEIEATGDPNPDYFIDVTFTPKMTSGATPQTATIASNFFTNFTAATSVPNLNTTGPEPVVTTDAATGISFVAGLFDDPFFFDIPGFNRFVASVFAGSPNAAALQRGRDSFAGYNTLAIALSIPASLIRGLLTASANNSVGTSARTARIGPRPTRGLSLSPVFTNVDREGNPAVNVALTPFARKNEYNLALTSDDARGDFATDIVSILTRLGTNATNIGILASVAISRGDILRLNLNTANTGPGGGNNLAVGFPNGRRLGDDTIDTLLFFIANQNLLGDNVNANDVPLRNTFPFLGASQQPREFGVDDNTRN